MTDLADELRVRAEGAEASLVDIKRTFEEKEKEREREKERFLEVIFEGILCILCVAFLGRGISLKICSFFSIFFDF